MTFLKGWLYAGGPIDFWVGWTPFDEAIASPDWIYKTFAEDLRAQQQVLKPHFQEMGWEGDGPWFIGGVVHSEPGLPEWTLAVKQSNNGTCFVHSPFELTHLTSDGCWVAQKVKTRKEAYWDYLSSDEWRLGMRKQALEMADHRCRVCNGSDRLEVHHRTYERVGRERASDLTVLCRDCHEQFHREGRTVS